MKRFLLVLFCVVSLGILGTAQAGEPTTRPALPEGYASWPHESSECTLSPEQKLITTIYTGYTTTDLTRILLRTTLNGELFVQMHIVTIRGVPLGDTYVYILTKEGWLKFDLTVPGESEKARQQTVDELGVELEYYVEQCKIQQ